MDFFTLINFLAMKKPELYGSLADSWFQYLWLVILVIATITAAVKMKDLNNKNLNKTLFTAGIVMVVFEIYKQLFFSYDAGWRYMWYAFPFQFCSVGMYLFILIPFVKNEKIRDGLIAFLATYSFFSGLAVMLYPATVFVSDVGINIQTMVHHGLLCVIGFGLLANYLKPSFKSFFRGMIVFFVLILIASFLNIVHNNFIKNGTFNMFFINPLYDTGIPILELVQPKVGPISFVIIYYLGFTFLAFIIFMTSKLVKEKLTYKKRAKMQIKTKKQHT